MAASRPEATSAPRLARGRTAFIVGAAFAVNAAAATALLLYTGQGFLRAAGVLAGVAIGALAAGLWVGMAPEPSPRGRWAATLIAYLVAALGVAAWNARPEVRGWPLGDALAMLIVLALPAYVTGLLLASLADEARGAGIAAMAGAALGVALAAGLLIPNVDAPLLFAGTATVIFLALLSDWRHARAPGAEMNGDVIIISGAAHRGQLAHTLALRFAADGARLVLTGRSDGVEAIAAELAADGAQAIAVTADLLDEDATRRVVETALERFGRIDALVNTAGGLTVIAKVADTSAEALRAELDRNLTTALNLTRAALPALRQTRGAVVNFASPAALRAPASLAAYSAAKAGIVALTRALAVEEREHGVRVNAIAPGMLDTLQNRESPSTSARFVSREEVAEVVRFLVSRESRGISGETIQVMGETIR